MPLEEYEKKRDFGKTPEPGLSRKGRVKDRFVVQKHDASHLHYDFRLQIGDVLVSWAVPRGPSMDSSVKRLAIQTEDHPLEYRDFEGVIPRDEYGGGTVMIWDEGNIKWPGKEAETGSPEEMLKKGQLVFELVGRKLKGRFRMIKTRYGKQKNAWLLMKSKDEHAGKDDILVTQPDSARSGRSLEEISAEESGEAERQGQNRR